MNMDRKYKEAENRTSEYLELKYGTDVQSGLSLAEVRRRRHLCGTYNIAKEKKRIWLICLKKECQNPYVLRGDIVRLKKGEQISSSVISLTKPYKEYQSGQVFTENTGRAIVIHAMDSSQEDLQWDDSKLGDLQSGNLQEDLQLEYSQLEACGIDNTTLQEKFSSILKKAEEQILESMCIFMCLSVVISLYIHQEGNMRRILEEGSFFFAVFMIGKEIAQEVFRRYAKRLEKINNT